MNRRLIVHGIAFRRPEQLSGLFVEAAKRVLFLSAGLAEQQIAHHNRRGAKSVERLQRIDLRFHVLRPNFLAVRRIQCQQFTMAGVDIHFITIDGRGRNLAVVGAIVPFKSLAQSVAPQLGAILDIQRHHVVVRAVGIHRNCPAIGNGDAGITGTQRLLPVDF